ncbi:hypothetical protein MWN33_09875 [Starkeya koreensis]|uniref:Uncharacterized protein n=1 Tax=Ancylobacter koreensis TaxID=266121 RepID=A0ABT0DMC5_9HYPH|nr:hypothetical protein [Ancylobacter koreensis]MCK0208339.1 hypothetical protein [Ancylobacter koreensis]
MSIRNTGVAALAAVALIAAVVPASATSDGPRNQPRIGDSPDRVQVREHERVREKQVRANEGRPIYQPIFAPLYEGYNSPWQRMKRSFD